MTETEDYGNQNEIISDENIKNVYKKIKSNLEILDIAFHPTQNNLITFGLINGKLKIYDLSQSDKRLVGIKKLHKKSIRKLAYPENSSHLIFTVSKDKSIKLTDLKCESNVLNIEKAHDSAINCLKVIDNWLIATADDNGSVKIWDYRRKTACMESTEDCADYISDLAVSNDKKTLLATCGEGTLTAFHIKKKKMVLQSELMDSEMLSVAFVKKGDKVVCGTGEGVLNIFNNNEWGNISDRFPGHPSSIDCILPLNPNVILTGCFDGNIRACSILPNKFLGIIGDHEGFPIETLCLSSDENVCASISHDNCVKFWNVEFIKSIKIDSQSKKKSKSKSLKNKNLTVKGKSENFFSDIIDKKESDEEDNDDDDDDEDDSEDEENSESESGQDKDEKKKTQKESDSDEEEEEDEEEEDADSDIPSDDEKETEDDDE